jgi:hypothetical protein
MADFSLKSGDTSPALTVTCSFSDGTLQDLTGAAVTFALRYPNGAIKVADAAAAIVGAPANGVVQYIWLTGDTDTPGNFEGEFHVTLSGGKIVSFPDAAYLEIAILPRVA